MNLVLTLLMNLVILMSGCLAHLDPGTFRDDIKYTTEFFDGQIRHSAHSELVLSAIRNILESLLTYHLPAEIALQSIDNSMEREIGARYNTLIGVIDQLLIAQYAEVRSYEQVRLNEAAALNDYARDLEEITRTIGDVRIEEEAGWRTVEESLRRVDDARGRAEEARRATEARRRNEKVLLKNLLMAVIGWAANHPGQAVDYIQQKLFVVMLHVYDIAQEPCEKSEMISLAATWMSLLNMDRLCVCEGIMLSVFLQRPFEDPDDQWEMKDIKKRLAIQTMWNDFLPNSATKPRIIKYLETAVIPDMESESDEDNTVDPGTVLADNPDESHVDNTVVADDPPESHLDHVYANFVKEIEGLVNMLGLETMMESSHRKQVLNWVARVWVRLCKPTTAEQRDFTSRVSREINTMINSIADSDTGTSYKN